VVDAEEALARRRRVVADLAIKSQATALQVREIRCIHVYLSPLCATQKCSLSRVGQNRIYIYIYAVYSGNKLL